MPRAFEPVFARSLERPRPVGQSGQEKEHQDPEKLRPALTLESLPVIQSGRFRAAFNSPGESRFPREMVVPHG